MNAITNPVLRKGIKGHENEIKRLKFLLKQQGFLENVAGDSFGPQLESKVAYFQQTHLGPTGVPLDVHGVVDMDTWWALMHPAGASQRSYIQTSIPSGLSWDREKVLAVALGQHGTLEVPNGSNRGPGVDPYLPGWYLKSDKKGPAWCCFFVSWVTKEALGSYPLGKREGSCWSAYKAAETLGMWVPNDGSYVPRPGDAFVMLHGGRKGHIGFVLRADDTRINTCEGNCGNRVKIGLRTWSGKDDITGFINFYKDQGQPMDFERGIVSARDVGADGTR